MEYDEAYGWVNLPYGDYQFTFHSSGNVMKKNMTVAATEFQRR